MIVHLILTLKRIATRFRVNYGVVSLSKGSGATHILYRGKRSNDI